MPPSIFARRHRVIAQSRMRPEYDNAAIGTAVTEMGARRVYWTWEQENFPAGRRWMPKAMLQNADGHWFVSDASRA